VHCPTHQSSNILNHILSLDDTGSVHDVIVIDTDLSNDSLVKCEVNEQFNRQLIVRATSRNWKSLDHDIFHQRLRFSLVYPQPAATAKDYSVQLETDITRILDEIIPFCSSTKRRRKPEGC
jgi:hypothetical protein